MVSAGPQVQRKNPCEPTVRVLVTSARAIHSPLADYLNGTAATSAAGRNAQDFVAYWSQNSSRRNEKNLRHRHKGCLDVRHHRNLPNHVHLADAVNLPNHVHLARANHLARAAGRSVSRESHQEQSNNGENEFLHGNHLPWLRCPILTLTSCPRQAWFP